MIMECHNVVSPCASCDHLGNAKIKEPCKACIKSGKPWNYARALGGLSESMPLDVMSYGNGGFEMPECKPDIDDIAYQTMINICSRHKVNIYNLQNGSVGAIFTRARMEIISYFLETSNKTQDEISEHVGITQARVSQLIRDLKSQKKVEDAKELKQWMIG